MKNASAKIAEFIHDLTPKQIRMLSVDWQLVARAEQLPPAGNWHTWLLLGGRGAGKTRAGSEWVHDAVNGAQLMGGGKKYGRIALVADSLSDAREVMIDGISGILNIAKRDKPIFEASRRRLVWPNGAIAQVFSSEDPESLRGPQFDAAWCDELAKWSHAQETWDMLQFALRLGDDPRQLVTTTPRATTLLKSIIADQRTMTVKMRTDDNASNLANSFLQTVRAAYGETRLGRQELDGELIEDREDALWNRRQIEALRIKKPPALERIVVAIDPPAAASAKSSCCGICVVGRSADGRAIVLTDGSIDHATPSQWAARAVKLFNRFDADIVIAEVNQGGDMVSAVLAAADSNLPIKMVRATRGKWLRAEPVAALYEQGKVAHLPGLSKLEDQMCDFGHNGLSDGTSPDRLDALVWALTALMLEPSNGNPIIRAV